MTWQDKTNCTNYKATLNKILHEKLSNYQDLILLQNYTEMSLHYAPINLSAFLKACLTSNPQIETLKGATNEYRGL